MTDLIKEICSQLNIKKKKRFLPLDELKRQCADRDIIKAKAYYARYREIPNAPSNPDKTYKDWVSWNDLLGNNLKP